MLSFLKIYYFIFGLLTIAGGVMGYIKAASNASLIAGGISGILIVVAALLLTAKTEIALLLGGLISIALIGRFAPAFFKEGAFMPAGLMTILSIVGLVLTVLTFFKR